MSLSALANAFIKSKYFMSTASLQSTKDINWSENEINQSGKICCWQICAEKPFHRKLTYASVYFM